MRQKLGCFDPANGVVQDVTELLPLVVGDRGLKILDFDQPLAYKYHLGDIVDAGDPGIADQLRIKG